MKRKDYENYKWYPLTDEEYLVEEMPYEFPNCVTIVYNTQNRLENNIDIKTYQNCSRGWGAMAKQGTYKFMIIEKAPKENENY